MNSFRYYTDTKIEYELAVKRLETLKDRKMVIWQKYFGIKSPNWDKIGAQGSRDDSDKMVQYLAEISRSKDGFPSIEEEIEQLRKEAQKLKKTLQRMETQLADTESVEGKLYYLIVVKKYSVNGAVKHIAETEYMSEANVWKTYYPRIKTEIRKLRLK